MHRQTHVPTLLIASLAAVPLGATSLNAQTAPTTPPRFFDTPPAPQAPLAPPAPLTPPAPATATATPDAPANDERFSIVINDDGTIIKIEGTASDFQATLNGTPIPPERIEVLREASREGIIQRFTIRDEQGDILARPSVKSRALSRITPHGRVVSNEQAIQLFLDDGIQIELGDDPQPVPQPAPEPRWMIGIQMGEVPDALAYHLNLDPANAIMIDAVTPDLPAEHAGLNPFDIIVGINVEWPVPMPANAWDHTDTSVTNQRLAEAVQAAGKSGKVVLDVIRSGQRETLRISPEWTQPADMPPPQPQTAGDARLLERLMEAQTPMNPPPDASADQLREFYRQYQDQFEQRFQQQLDGRLQPLLDDDHQQGLRQADEVLQGQVDQLRSQLDELRAEMAELRRSMRQQRQESQQNLDDVRERTRRALEDARRDQPRPRDE